MFSAEKTLIDQLRATIKAALEAMPPGEHLHVAAIIAEQNAEIVRLKTLNRRLRAQRRAALSANAPPVRGAAPEFCADCQDWRVVLGGHYGHCVSVGGVYREHITPRGANCPSFQRREAPAQQAKGV